MAKIIDKDLEYIFNKTTHFVNEFNGKSIFITGGTGFIGKWILEFLLYLINSKSFNFNVIVLSRNPDLFLNQYPHFRFTNFQFIQGDIISFDYNQLPHTDIIIHAATEANAKLNHEQPLHMIDTIVEGTRKVLDYAVRVKSIKVLYLSSGAVYGVQPNNLNGFPEDYCGGPNILLTSSAYAEAKRLAELSCVCYQKQHQLNITIARCFAFVGPYLPLDMHFAIGNFIGNGLKGEDIIIKGNGIPTRSYMYPTDLITWLLFLIINGESGQAYNVGSDEPISIIELARLVSKKFPSTKVKVLNQVSPTDRNQNYIPDISKIKQELGVQLTIDLETAISKTIDFYK
jgi:nucleoside-diphosphate-sugar epimerase